MGKTKSLFGRRENLEKDWGERISGRDFSVFLW